MNEEQQRDVDDAVGLFKTVMAEIGPERAIGLLEEMATQQYKAHSVAATQQFRSAFDGAKLSFQTMLGTRMTAAIRQIQRHSYGFDPNEVLPRGTRFYRTSPGNFKIVVEQTPRVRTLIWNVRPDVTTGESYAMSLPYTIFVFLICSRRNGEGEESVFSCNDVRLFYRNQPLQSLQDVVHHPAISNINRDTASICRGSMLTDEGHQILPEKLSDWMETFIERFWGSVFNRDWAQNLDEMTNVDDRCSTFPKWANATSQNPAFSLEVPWRAYKTLESVLSEWGEDSEFAESAEQISAQILQRVERELVEDISMLCNRMEYMPPPPVISNTLSADQIDRVAKALAEVVAEGFGKLQRLHEEATRNYHSQMEKQVSDLQQRYRAYVRQVVSKLQGGDAQNPYVSGNANAPSWVQEYEKVLKKIRPDAFVKPNHTTAQPNQTT